MGRVATILLILVLMVSLVGCSGANEPSKAVGNNPNQEQEEPIEEKEEKGPEPMVKEEKALAGAFMVSIDNNGPARPQSGLDKADRVYEIIAEGGITRFLAIFHSQEAEKIGPVRSARYYFTYIVKGHNLPFAHAGGSTQALNLIRELKLKDLDEIYNAGGYFFRTKDRKMPYNLYTSTELLTKGSEAKNYKLLPLKPLEQGIVSGGEDTNEIDIIYNKIEKYLYKVSYQWDGQRYQRYINGSPHKTLEGNEIYTENVIVLAAKTRDVVTDQLRSEVDLIGKGEALFFTDGKVYKGSWEKPQAQSEFNFLYEGNPMNFKGEHAWINVIGNIGNVEYKN